MIVPPAVLAAVIDIRTTTTIPGLDSTQRAKLLQVIRNRALGRQFDTALATAKTVTLTGPDGAQWSISIRSVQWTDDVVELSGVVVLRDGANMLVDPHQLFANPPLLFPDDTGIETRSHTADDGSTVTRTFRVDPAACILDVLIQQARR